MDFKEFYNKLYVESVTFSIADSEKEIETLGDLSQQLTLQFHKFLLNNGYTNESIPDTLRGYDNVIAIDGDSDYFGQEGILNVYTDEIMNNLKDKTLGMIKYYIGEFNAELLNRPYVETSGIRKGDVWRFKIKINPVNNQPPELNLSNANARILLIDILGYPSDMLEEYPNISANELLMKIEQIEDNDYVINKNQRKDKQEGNMISMGLSPEQIKQRLNELKKVCQWAIENDYTYIQLS